MLFCSAGGFYIAFCSCFSIYLLHPSFSAVPCNIYALQLPAFAKKSNVRANQLIAVGRQISLTFECEIGYNLISAGIPEFQVGPVWLYSSRCDLVNCEQPPLPANSIFTGMKTLFVNYSCNSAYKQTSGSTYLDCAANGKWIGRHIVCKGEVLILSLFGLSVITIQVYCVNVVQLQNT